MRRLPFNRIEYRGGFERGSWAEFVRFLMIAKGSCAEVRSQLYSALDVGYLTQEKFDMPLAYAESAGRILGRYVILRKGKQ